ncbi:hypothetical protein GCM10011611_05060 [Aliidongia dinghuensis]|uniref:Uncharacterized protein n=1 Tax=Aliidongia dinghuensis TaxID=1867774 RepID=A0A8J3E1N1_9PROT|nr:hypothetical protein [Aliidongia dinghuensis]GGF02564.1 hypothetical protein GCM10011611_05060 [Aliidongia dinghuensis]
MLTRSHIRTVTFERPFRLAGCDGEQPAGRYVVETEEELLQSLSFPAWHRVRSTLRAADPPAGAMRQQVAEIHPADLEQALAQDAAGTVAQPSG